MKMEYTVQVIRGWPFDGSLDRYELIKTGSTLQNGDWVVKQTDNTVDLVGTAESNVAFGLVIRGNGDSGSAANTGKAVVLWGNFIAQIKNLRSGATFTPGVAVTIKRDSTNRNYVDLISGSGRTVGFVLDVIGASASQDASIIVQFN